ncbi:MAG: polymer-forming cytoskeletal protein [Candidatus Acidiferrales bacterium]
MWGDKKPDAPPKSPLPQQPQQPQQSHEARQNIPSTNAPASAGEAKTMAPVDTTFPNTSTSSGSSARLGSSLHVKGEITGNEDLLIDGSVEGLVQLEDRKLTVGASAKVTADVIAREVVIYGNVKGNLRARDRIEIKKDGSVVGDLTTARISIEDGAYFKGSIEIDKAGEASSSDKGSFARSNRTTAATTTS